MEISTPKIDYAPRPPLHRRRYFWRSVVAVLLAALLIAGYTTRARWRPHWERVGMLYAQRQCLNYVAPARTVVYSDDPTVVESVKGKREYQRRTLSSSVGKYDFVFLPAEPWQSFAARGWRGDEIGGTTMLVLHGMNAPNGPTWLATITFFHRQASSITFVAHLIPPRTFRGPDASWYEQVIEIPTPTMVPTENPLTFLAARYDAANPGRFTLPYLCDGQDGVIVGTFPQVGPSPRLEIRVVDGPLRP